MATSIHHVDSLLNNWVILASGDPSITGISHDVGRVITPQEKFLASKRLQHNAGSGMFRVITDGKQWCCTPDKHWAIFVFNAVASPNTMIEKLF